MLNKDLRKMNFIPSLHSKRVVSCLITDHIVLVRERFWEFPDLVNMIQQKYPWAV